MKEVYDQLCTFDDADDDEITVDAFIRITTQEFSNLNTQRIIKTIKEFDEDEDGVVHFDEFLDLIACLNETQEKVREECMHELEDILKLDIKNKI